MTRLSVNVNKLATLRNSREKNLPDVPRMAHKILEFGAHGITIHPRPDGRHIRLPDVSAIQTVIKNWNHTPSSAKGQVEYNIEGYPSDEFLDLILKVKPDQCTLVPDPPEALTSNAGWILAKNEPLLSQILQRLREGGVRSSLFIDPFAFDEAETKVLKRLKPDRIELYTEAFADHFSTPKRNAVADEYKRVAQIAKSAEIDVNAGHDLNQQNLGFLLQVIPWMDEVSIGHALICEALEEGMETTVLNYLKILRSR